MLRFFNPLNYYTLFLACLLIPMGTTFVGCDVNEGPAEEAGEDIDDAADDIEEGADDATD